MQICFKCLKNSLKRPSVAGIAQLKRHAENILKQNTFSEARQKSQQGNTRGSQGKHHKLSADKANPGMLTVASGSSEGLPSRLISLDHKLRSGGWRDLGSALKAFLSLPGTPCLVPSTHGGWLISTRNSGFRGVTHPSGLWGYTLPRAIHTNRNKKNGDVILNFQLETSNAPLIYRTVYHMH